MTCGICRRVVRDRRSHRHLRENEQLRVTVNYGREVARQERELLRRMLRQP